MFPCGSEIGLEIHRALSFSTHVELVGASSVASNHGKYVFRHYVEGLPFVDAPEFVTELNRVVSTYDIDFVFPAHDSVALKLAQHAANLACDVIGSPAATCAVCRSKAATYAALGSAVPTPKVFDRADRHLPFPVFLKPEVGQGSHGVHVAHSSDELRFYLETVPSLLILEYLPGEEYTVDCLTDRHGALRFAGPRQRVRTVNGISVDTRPVQGEEFGTLARRINETLRFRGPWFFQVKRRAEGELVLLEVAPRVSGGMGLYRNAGVNIPLLSVFDRMGLDVAVLHNDYALEMDRALFSRFRLDLEYEHVYIDLDDTLLFRGRVNVPAVAFVYQCRNRGVLVHLVSRHEGDIEQTLRDHGLAGLFDSVVSLDRLTCKSECVEAERAIFIDDSFAERKRVHDALGIPTFGVDAIESLMDWRT